VDREHDSRVGKGQFGDLIVEARGMPSELKRSLPAGGVSTAEGGAPSRKNTRGTKHKADVFERRTTDSIARCALARARRLSRPTDMVDGDGSKEIKGGHTQFLSEWTRGSNLFNKRRGKKGERGKIAVPRFLEGSSGVTAKNQKKI